jgi:hypothetical protein
MSEPEPVDEGKPAPEIRGGDRPEDYLPGTGGFGLIEWVANGGFPPGTFTTEEDADEKADGDSA